MTLESLYFEIATAKNARAVLDIIKKETVGYTHKEIPFAEGVDLLVEKAGTEKLPSILFTAHIDSLENRSDVIFKDGSFTGKGAGDDIAGVLALILALKDLPEKHGDVSVLFTDKEEKGCLGGIAFFENNTKKYDAVISVDGNGEIGKGYYADYLALGYQINFYDRVGYFHIPFGSEDVSVNRGDLKDIDGKSACTLTIRCADKNALEKWFKKLSLDLGIFITPDEKNREYFYKGKYGKMGVVERRRFGYIGGRNSQNVVEYVKKTFKKDGFDFECVKSLKGGSDATYALKYGYPALILNSGVKNAHTERESVSENDILTNAKLIKRLLGIF